MSNDSNHSSNAGDHLTFSDLKDEAKLREIAKHGDVKGTETHKSDVTSLKRFLRINDLQFDDPIKNYLAIPFTVLSVKIKDELLSSSYSEMSKYVYISRMKKINAIALEMCGGFTNKERSLPEIMTMAFNNKKIEEPGLTKADFARRIGMSSRQLSNWYSLGKRRPGASDKNILIAVRLAQHLDIDKDELISRLAPIHRSKFTSAREINDQRFGGKKEVSLVEIPYRALTLPPRLSVHFDDYVRFKTVIGFKKNFIGKKMNTGKTLWRIKKGRSGLPATARKKLINLQTYAGWLMLPSTMDGARAFIRRFCSRTGKKIQWERRLDLAKYFIGCGLTADEIHPIHLVDPDYMERFISWMNLRGHQNRYDFIDDALALINESSGYLKQQVELVWDYGPLELNPVSIGDPDWKNSYAAEMAKWTARCSDWRGELKETKKFIERVSGVIKAKLDPILIKSDILGLLRDMVARHTSDQPPAKLRHNHEGSKHLAVWIRDQLLLRKLISNPLRALNFAEMTYRENGSGSLRKCPERGWRLVFKPEDFKNQQGAAKEPYDVGLPEDLWPLIELYLKKARPILLRNRKSGEMSDRLFLTDNGEDFDGSSISYVVYMLTARFGELKVDTVGIRTHAFRHLIATAWLKNHRYDYYTVAQLLHDDIYTVIRVYGHNGPEDVLTAYQKELALPSFRFDDRRDAA